MSERNGRFGATRRDLLAGLGAGALVAGFAGAAHGEAIAVAVDALKPGEFTWHPERSPSGPLAIVVSLPDQRVFVYRNGIRIAVSTCSTGKPGYATPTGVFTILQKDKNHHSSTYDDAPMPNMNRLTWSGIALHAGNLPGYPASHGCVRLPLDFSAKLFTITRLGTPVIIADAATFPSSVVHPGMVLASDAEHDFESMVTKTSAETAASGSGGPPSTSIIVSSADSRIIILDDGVQVSEGKVTVANPIQPLGNHVFILSGVDAANKALHWETIGYFDDAQGGVSPTELSTIQRIRADHASVEAMRARMRAGTVLITTDVPLTADTRSGTDFVILDDSTVS